MRRALALILGAGMLLAAGCGQSSSERPAVARYITQVNRVEQQLTPPLTSITRIGAQFAQGKGIGGGSLSGFVEQTTMSGVLARVSALRGQLAALPPPPPAVRLRSLLLQVIDGQVRTGRELQQLVVFLPRFNAALQPLGSDMQRLEAVLSEQTAYGSAAVASVYADKAAALRSFQASLHGILAKLGSLQPPAVSKPDYDAQVQSLTGMSANAGKLADALADGPQGNVQPLLTAFEQAAAGAQSATAQRAHAAAVRSYNGQIAQINQLAQDAERERLRLANTLS